MFFFQLKTEWQQCCCGMDAELNRALYHVLIHQLCLNSSNNTSFYLNPIQKTFNSALKMFNGSIFSEVFLKIENAGKKFEKIYSMVLIKENKFMEVQDPYRFRLLVVPFTLENLPLAKFTLTLSLRTNSFSRRRVLLRMLSNC